jgi:hypothetical protein
MSRHRLDRRRRPGKLQCKSTPHRRSIAQSQRRGFYGQLGGIGVAAAVIAVPLICGGVAVVGGFPLDLSSPPSAPTAQRPLGPSWLPGGGVGLHTSPNPLFRVPLDGSVASSPEVLHTALSASLPSSTQPVGFWVGTHWVSADPIVRPTEPCPSPVLDPAGWMRWWHRFFPGVTPPAPPASGPVTTPPVVTTSPVTAPPADTVPPAAPIQDPPPASSLPAQTQPVVEDQPVTQPVTVDAPPLDVPPVVVDVPVLPPVEVDPPSVDLPPVEIPPVDTITDPIVDVVNQSQDATTGAEDSVPLAAAVDSIVAPVDGISESTLAGAEQHPTLLGSLTNHSTSGNTFSDRGRLAGENDGEHVRDRLGVLRPNSPSSPRGDGARLNGGAAHHPHSYVGKHRAESDHKSERKSSGRHAKSSHSKSESHSKSGGKSHSGGSKSHSGGSHGGGRHGR